ncbi:MAG: hypothetical protein ABS46_15190 [Cytophagaceae bacterium SCN 52-12]|nr:MAG: hypothetical protein ABS46_15190 [Cytophagaceae bacterium SCN 52-12]
MNKLITPDLSDQLLDFLVQKVNLGDYEEFKSHDFPKSDQLSVDAVDVLLDDLREKGLIEILSRGHSGYDYTYEISVNKAAIDFQRGGGFKGRELLLKDCLNRLLLELETLPDVPAGKKETIRDLAARIRTCLSGIKSS